MTNEPGFRMVLGKLKQMLEAFLNIFNVSLPSTQAAQAHKLSRAGTANDLPLAIGNELLITDDIIKLHKGLSNSRGRVVIIDQIPNNDYAPIKASAFGIQVNVDMKAAQSMRAAYIFREQTPTVV